MQKCRNMVKIFSKNSISREKFVCVCMKLYMVGQRRKGTIPFPEMMVITTAAENDLTVFKTEFVPYLNGKTVFADKISLTLMKKSGKGPYSA